MEWFNFKELGFTLLIGSFTIIGVEAVLHYCLNWNLIGFFEGRLGLRRPPALQEQNASGKPTKGEREATLTLLTFVAFAFGIGVLFEDLSRRSVLEVNSQTRIDQDFVIKLPAKLAPDTASYLRLPSDEDARVFLLVGTLKEPRPNALAHDLARNNAFEIHGLDRDLSVQKWINSGCQPGQCPEPGDITDSIVDLYFIAKNTAYKQDHYFDELREIQTRYEFLGTLAWLAFVFFALAVVVGLPSWIIHFHRSKPAGNRSRRLRWILNFRKNENSASHTRLRPLRGIPIIIIVFASVYLFSLWGFALEADAFNQRVFGYLSTAQIWQKNQEKLALPSPTPTPKTGATHEQSQPTNRSIERGL